MKLFYHTTFLTLALLSLTSAHKLMYKDPIKEYLAPHNATRSQIGVGPLRWDNTLVAYAHSYASTRARDCNLIHSSEPYGENLAMSTGNMSIEQAVNLWVNEKDYYDYGSNNCIGGQLCLHYTQVIWKDTMRIGCAKVSCANGGTFVSCNYDPPGNFVDERPY